MTNSAMEAAARAVTTVRCGPGVAVSKLDDLLALNAITAYFANLTDEDVERAAEAIRRSYRLEGRDTPARAAIKALQPGDRG